MSQAGQRGEHLLLPHSLAPGEPCSREALHTMAQCCTTCTACFPLEQRCTACFPLGQRDARPHERIAEGLPQLDGALRVQASRLCPHSEAEGIFAVGGAHHVVTEADNKSETQDKLKREAHALRRKLKREVSLQQGPQDERNLICLPHKLLSL